MDTCTDTSSSILTHRPACCTSSTTHACARMLTADARACAHAHMHAHAYIGIHMHDTYEQYYDDSCANTITDVLYNSSYIFHDNLYFIQQLVCFMMFDMLFNNSYVNVINDMLYDDSYIFSDNSYVIR